MKKALNGDMKAIEELVKIMGEAPAIKQEISNTNVQKIYVTKEDIENADKHIKDIIEN